MFKNDSEEFEVRVNTINKTHEAFIKKHDLFFNFQYKQPIRYN